MKRTIRRLGPGAISLLLGTALLFPHLAEANGQQALAARRVERTTIRRENLSARVDAARLRIDMILNRYTEGRGWALGVEAFVGGRAGYGAVGGGDVGLVVMRDGFGKVKIGVSRRGQGGAGYVHGGWLRGGLRIMGDTSQGAGIERSRWHGATNLAGAGGLGGGVEVSMGPGHETSYALYGAIGFGAEAAVSATKEKRSGFGGLTFRSRGLRRAERIDGLVKELEQLPGLSQLGESGVMQVEKKLRKIANLLGKLRW